MEYVISFLWVVLELLCIFFLASAFFKKRYGRRHTLLFMVIAACVMGLSRLLMANTVPLLLRVVIPIATVTAIILLENTGPWYQVLTLACVYYFFNTAMDSVFAFGAAALLNMTLEELVWKKFLYTMVVTIDKSLLLFLCWGLYRIRRDGHGRKLGLKRIILSTLFPFLSLFMLFSIYRSYLNQGDLSAPAVAFSFILIVANAAALYLLDSLDQNAAARQELALMNQSMALQTENYEALEKSYRAQRTASHEYKHQLQVIGDLLKAGHTQEAQEYIEQLQAQETTRIFAANSKHPIIDAILNEKYQCAKENNIDITYRVNDLSGLKIPNDALVVLLSNLLDNAVEGCLRLGGNRVIECSLILEDELLFSVRNTSPPVEILDGHIETSKKPKAEHGYGLNAIRRVIQQLNGEYVIDYTKPWFQFTAELPNN